MLSSRFRFHGHGSLRFVYAKGSVSRSKYFICKATVNHRRVEPRIAVVISKKVMKSAVSRNRIRRRLYETIRLELPALHPHSDIVFIVVSPELLTAQTADITQAVRSVLTQADLYKTAKS
jgi:ribonuclease P protein component